MNIYLLSYFLPVNFLLIKKLLNMLKKLFLLLLTSISFVGWSQQQKPIPTQLYPGLIAVDNPVHINEVNSLLTTTFNMSPNDALIELNSTTDEVGYTHIKYQHYYKGIEVEGSSVTAHVLNSFVKTFSGSYRSFGTLSTQPSISENTARTNALTKIGAKTYLWEQEQTAPPAGQLVLFTIPQTTETRLAYKLDIYSVEPLYRAWVFVDAQNGKVLFENNRIHHTDVSASGNSLYNGNVAFTADYTGSNYRLRQTSSGSGIQTFNLNNGTNYSAATDFTSNSATSWSDATGIQAHYGAEKTHAYFLSNHNRNSFNGNGATINSYVHYSNNYVNAFWDGSRMTYGDGNATYSPLVSLDIVGHEITHGVTNYSANLVYSYESGALNESFSDIFGEAIENYATGSNNWLMGSEIGAAFRSMSNPNVYGDPDTYQGTYWYTGSGDNGGVHYNSGVQNKWFYILSQGETGTNDFGSSYAVTGIGISDAAKIAYRNLTVYLSSNSQYADARAGAIQAAVDLFGAGSPEVIATTNAWYAVGVGGAYGGGGGPAVYCNSAGSNANYEWISSVNVGSFTNNSGSAGYSDFTNLTINVNAGQTYAVSFSPTFPGTTYNESWKVWIDYNGDADFNDAGELVFSAGLTPNTVSGNITIPANASGSTRMRVSMKWNGAQSACEVFSYGEVEDYTISIGSGSGPDVTPPSAPTNLSAANTTTTSTNLSWSASTDNVGVTGYDVYVDGTLGGSTTGLTYALTGLTPSTSYNVYVKAKDAANNESQASNTITVTTQSLADVQPPTAPGNLAVNNITQTSADVSWTASTDNVGVVGYDVLVNGSLVGTTVATSYALSSLSANTTYSVTVTAKDAASNTNSSSTNFTTLSSGGGSTVLLGSYFESGWDGWADGGSDCSRYGGSRSWEGSYSIMLRDNSGVASSMTSPAINLSGYSQVDVEFYFYANSMENNEDFWVRYYNGSSWTTVATYASGSSFSNNTFYVATVTLNSGNFNFANNAQFRFQCDASANNDQIYIDAITITASNPNNFIATNGPDLSIKEVGRLDESIALADEIILYPNPAMDYISLETSNTPERVMLLSLTGQILGDYRDETEYEHISVSHLPAGTYMVAVYANEEVTYLKFVKQ